MTFTNSGFSGKMSMEKANELIKAHYNLKTIREDQFQVLFAQLVSEEYRQYQKGGNDHMRVQNSGTVYVLAEVIVDGVRYTEYKEDTYNTSSISALSLQRRSNIPVGTRMEATVGNYPSSGPSVTLSHKSQEVTSSFSCGGDEIARAQAIWQSQSADTYTLLLCDA